MATGGDGRFVAKGEVGIPTQKSGSGEIIWNC